MAINNKTIETEKNTSFHVILVKRDGVKKFVSKSFTSCFPCTVLLDKAKRFKSKTEAQTFIDVSLVNRNDMEVIEPVEVINTLKLNIT